MSKNKKDKKYYNRELSWVKFNERVLDEAKDKSLPISDRLKFISISSSNLDEFFMVRVASLKDMINVGYKKNDISGMSPSQQLISINKLVHKLVETQYKLYNELRSKMGHDKYVFLKSKKNLNSNDIKYLDTYFKETIYPVLTPIILNNSSTFPLVQNKSNHIIVKLKKKKTKKIEFAVIPVPTILSRLVQIPIPNESDKFRVILLEEVIEKYAKKLFRSYDIEEISQFRITRNAGLSLDEDDVSDLLNKIKKKLHEREWGEIIRLEVKSTIDKSILKFLKNKFNVNKNNIYEINGPIDLTFLMDVIKLTRDVDPNVKKEHEGLYLEGLESNYNIFDKIDSGDILLHHPYHSYEPVVEFIKQASEDPDVLAIKQTLYRVSSDSPIVKSLLKAAENGKEVTVVVELKARFDEENNIEWATILERAGCHVIYGIPNMKIHSKIALVVRKDSKSSLKRYIHLGTGNYNEKTAKLYTDISYLTSDDKIGEDASMLFNYLSGDSKPSKWNKLIVAPDNMKDEFIRLIRREKKNAENKKTAEIIAKMNSLCDKDIIDELYSASKSGVKISLIVRGICSLKPGVKGISDNIKVISVVGEFLEHSRVYYFYNNGKPEVYCASADWMPRNLEKRIELLFPVPITMADYLKIYLKDNTKAREMLSSGKYVRKKPKENEKSYIAQEVFKKKPL